VAPSTSDSASSPTTERIPRWAVLAAFLGYFALLWFFWGAPAVYPIKIFVVFLHEISHGFAAVLTGGRIDRIVLEAAEGGACYCPGGSAFLTLSAGYLGSLLWGCLLVIAGMQFGRFGRAITGVVGAGTAALTLVYVRSGFGIVFGLAFGVALLLVARYLPQVVNRALLVVLGLTSCMYAVLDIKSDVLDRPHLESDAHMLAELTGIPTVVWGVLWIGLGLVMSTLLLKRAAGKG